MATASSLKQPFHPALTRKLLQLAGDQKEKKRISNEALIAAGELLRIFVAEARHRAAIEAECETESDIKEDIEGSEVHKAKIQPHHITRIAAELLMDYS